MYHALFILTRLVHALKHKHKDNEEQCVSKCVQTEHSGILYDMSHKYRRRWHSEQHVMLWRVATYSLIHLNCVIVVLALPNKNFCVSANSAKSPFPFYILHCLDVIHSIHHFVAIHAWKVCFSCTCLQRVGRCLLES